MNTFNFNLAQAPRESYFNDCMYEQTSSRYLAGLPYNQPECGAEVLRTIHNDGFEQPKIPGSNPFASDFNNDDLFNWIKPSDDNVVEIQERPEICIDSHIQSEMFLDTFADPSEFLSTSDPNAPSMMKRVSIEPRDDGEQSTNSTCVAASRGSFNLSEGEQLDQANARRASSTCFSTSYEHCNSYELTSVNEETEEVSDEKRSAALLKSASKKISKKRLQVSTSKGRKTKEQMKLLLSYFHLYKGKWDDELFGDLVEKTGFNKKQLNKWMWDRKKKVSEAVQAKSYLGLSRSLEFI